MKQKVREVFGMRKKLVVLVVLLMFGMMLVSCSSEPEIGGNVIELSYKSRYAAPSVENIQVAPRSSVTEEDEFYVTFDVKNYGSADLRDGKVRVFGYDDRYIDVGSVEPLSFTIPAYDEESPIELFEEMEFEGETGVLLNDELSHSMTLFMETSFMYSTLAEADVCINPSSYDVYGGCSNPELDEMKSFGAQYSPVIFSSYTQNVFDRENTVYFTFVIENKGEGSVDMISLINSKLTTDELEACEFVGDGEEGRIDSVLQYTFDEGEDSVELDCEFHYGSLSSATTKALFMELVYEYKLLDTVKFTINADRNR